MSNLYKNKIRRQLPWLLGQLVLVVGFLLLRNNQSVMEWWCDYAGDPFRLWLSKLFSPLPFTMMEVFWGFLFAEIIVFLVRTIVYCIKAKKHLWWYLLHRLIFALNIALTISVAFCYLWGTNYYIDGFQEDSGIYAEESTVQQLVAVTQYFADKVTEYSTLVERDSSGSCCGDLNTILSQSTEVYDALEEVYPFLKQEDVVAKPVFFSRIMSLMDFTGVTFPLTGEVCINVDVPLVSIPSTIAHEIGHQKGYALEKECNFMAVLACTTYEDSLYQYSGYMLGYIYLANSLYKISPDLYSEIYFSLGEEVKRDLRERSAYWAQFSGNVVSKASNKVYDSFLKGYGETEGLQSYGLVTDLLITYYYPLLEE